MDHRPSVDLLESIHFFPGVYKIKAIGLADDDFESRVVEAVMRTPAGAVGPGLFGPEHARRASRRVDAGHLRADRRASPGDLRRDPRSEGTDAALLIGVVQAQDMAGLTGRPGQRPVQ